MRRKKREKRRATEKWNKIRRENIKLTRQKE